MSSFPRALLSPPQSLSADSILSNLTRSQHLHPHWALGRALDDLAKATGLCPDLLAAAIRWLNLDTTRLLGRYRRTELSQLARNIRRRLKGEDCTQ